MKDGRVYPSIQETQNLITKLAESNFTGESCQKEYEALRKSETDSMLALKEEKAKNAATVLQLGTKLSHIGTCKFLKRFSTRRLNDYEASFIQSTKG